MNKRYGLLYRNQFSEWKTTDDRFWFLRHAAGEATRRTLLRPYARCWRVFRWKDGAIMLTMFRPKVRPTPAQGDGKEGI